MGKTIKLLCYTQGKEQAQKRPEKTLGLLIKLILGRQNTKTINKNITKIPNTGKVGESFSRFILYSNVQNSIKITNHTQKQEKMALSKEKKKTNRNCPRKYLMANLPKTLKKFPKHAKITKGKVDKIKKMKYEQNKYQ